MGDMERFLKAVEFLRQRVHKEMPAQHISLLLTVADNSGITMPELCHKLDMPQGTVSRNVKVLSNYIDHSHGVARTRGRNLLCTRPDSSSRNCLAVFLTGRGEAIVAELMKIIYPTRSDDVTSDTTYRRRYYDQPAVRVSH